MEASQGNVRGVVDTLTKVVEALNRAGLELVADYARSDGRGRGVRMREPEQDRSIKTKVPTKKTGRVGSGREKMPDSAMNNAGGTQRRK
jgi:hypothetical protein